MPPQESLDLTWLPRPQKHKPETLSFACKNEYGMWMSDLKHVEKRVWHSRKPCIWTQRTIRKETQRHREDRVTLAIEEQEGRRNDVLAVHGAGTCELIGSDSRDARSHIRQHSTSEARKPGHRLGGVFCQRNRSGFLLPEMGREGEKHGLLLLLLRDSSVAAPH
jgi:hypothetical protein